MPTKNKHRNDKFTWGPDNPPTPIASCALCEHLAKPGKCTAYPNGIPADILDGKDYHFEHRVDQVGTDVFKPVDGVNLPPWLRKESPERTGPWQQFRNEKVERPEHQSAAGQFRVIACDTFEGPFADEFVGEFTELDEAIVAAKSALSPMMAVYVYDDTGHLRFSQHQPSEP